MVQPLVFTIFGDDRTRSAFATLKKSVEAARRPFDRLEAAARRFGDRMEAAGAQLSARITAPVALMGGLTLKAAGDFEQGMNAVRAALGNVDAETMKSLTDQAKRLGSTTQFSASEAAAGIEMLVKNGLSAEQVLAGATDATLKLAAAGGTSLAPAADVVTDAMAQFGKEIKDLPNVVDQISGVLVASKFDFENFAYALGAAGGVAGGVGVSFEDFNAALAATAPAFSSGSDAGTSFKTFLGALVPKSEAAAKKIADLGLEFFDASGNMKSMSDIAQELQDAVSGLSDESKIGALQTIFGSDAIRTALMLADQGAAGIERLKTAIAGISADDQAKARMEGFNGSLREFSSAVEGLQIAIGDAGALQWATDFVKAMTGWVQVTAQLNPDLLKWGTILAGGLAIIGPVVAGIGLIASGFSALASVASGVASVIGLVFGGVAAVVGAVPAAIGIAVLSIVVFRDEIMAGIGWLRDQMPYFSIFFETLGDIVNRTANFIQAIFNFDALGALGEISGLFYDLIGRVRELFSFIQIGNTDGTILDTGFVASVSENFSSLVRGVDAFVEQLHVVTDAGAEAVAALGCAFADMAATGIDAVRRLYQGVQTWISDGLSRIWDSAKEKVRAVGDEFYRLWDRVVGHSYVPDMVSAIDYEMTDRLDVTWDHVGRRLDESSLKFADFGKSVTSNLRKTLMDGKLSIDSLKDLLGTIGSDFANRILERALEPLEKPISDMFSKFETALFGGGDVSYANVGANGVPIPAAKPDMTNPGGIFGGLFSKSLGSLFSGDWLSRIFSGIGSAFSAGTNFFSSLLAGLFGGFFADGGTLAPGRVGVVGERGPELVTAGSQPVSVTPLPRLRSQGLGAAGIASGGRTLRTTANVTVNLAGYISRDEVGAIAEAASRSGAQQAVETANAQVVEILRQYDRDFG